MSTFYIKEITCIKRAFFEMVLVKREHENSHNKTNDIEHLNSAYNIILDLLS